MKHLITSVAVILVTLTTARAAENVVLVEAESFKEYGGWVLDTQFVHIMGSPYLMAHGLGEPVKDATTTVTLPSAGKWNVFVRTKDWVARWKAPGQPGKFQLLVDGQPLKATFGAEGADWFWHAGGSIEAAKSEITLALHDLTGFEGRCDAIIFAKDAGFVPPADAAQLASWRKKTLGLPEKIQDAGNFDLVVVGGGYGGLGAALSGSRMGCKVAFIQDRPVLGGNGSSEIRVWSQGFTTLPLSKFPRLGEIVEEFADVAKASPGIESEFVDAKKEAIVRAEKNITLFLNTQAFAVEKNGNKIVAVIARNTRTSAELRFPARLVADCTGHGTIAALAGAEFAMADGSGGNNHMGMSNMWRWKDTGEACKFPETPWALPLAMADFPYPRNGKAEWFWEGGFFRHPINDLEYIRDWNFRAAYGAFNAMKNGDGKEKHANAKMEWLAYIGGPRESRLIKGDLVLTKEDIINKVEFPDGCVPTTWSIDLHVPKEQFDKKFPEDPFISKAIFDGRVDKKQGYPVPYRCFYSKDINNLFMAGRHISVDRGALGTIRVMRTIGMMGEVVGKAASICIRKDCAPRDVYQSHLNELKELMNLPGNARRSTVNDPIDPNAPLPSEESMKKAPAKRAGAEGGETGINPSKLAGIVVDDAKATLTGNWASGQGLKGFVGAAYRYAGAGKDEATARFEFNVPATGSYEVRFSYTAHENRPAALPVHVISADGDKKVEVNEQAAPKLEHGFTSLGVFRFEAGKPGAVFVTTKDAKGTVCVDAVQVLPAK